MDSLALKKPATGPKLLSVSFHLSIFPSPKDLAPIFEDGDGHYGGLNTNLLTPDKAPPGERLGGVGREDMTKRDEKWPAICLL